MMLERMKTMLALSSIVLLCGCNGDQSGSTRYSCSYKDSAGGSNAGTCTYYGVSGVSVDQQQREQIEQICTASQGVYSSDPCPADDLIGTCVQFEGSEGEVSISYYANFDGGVAEAERTCAAMFGDQASFKLPAQ